MCSSDLSMVAGPSVARAKTAPAHPGAEDSGLNPPSARRGRARSMLSSMSGCFFPRDMFPQTMKRASLFIPHGWALKAFDAVLIQSTVDVLTVATCCTMLIAFAVAFFAVGTWRFRNAT